MWLKITNSRLQLHLQEANELNCILDSMCIYLQSNHFLKEIGGVW